MEEAKKRLRRAIAERDEILATWPTETAPTQRERATVAALFDSCEFNIAEAQRVLESAKRSQESTKINRAK